MGGSRSSPDHFRWLAIRRPLAMFTNRCDHEAALSSTGSGWTAPRRQRGSVVVFVEDERSVAFDTSLNSEYPDLRSRELVRLTCTERGGAA